MRKSSPIPTLACALAALALATCWTAPSALAEVPSVDAYGGEALVLGAPHHHRPGGGSGSTGKGAGALGKGSGAPGEGAGANGRSSTGHRGNLRSANGEAGATKGSATGASGNGGSAHGAGGQAQGRSGSGEALAGRDSQPASFNGPSAASSSAFGTLDLLLLIAGAICLAALALVLRTARKPG